MILPIAAYGDPVLRKVADEIEADYPNLRELIENMFDTLHNANGVGLTACQVGLPISLFAVDAAPIAKEKGNEHLKDFKKVFINPEIIEERGKEWSYNEGCLSLPDIREDIVRKFQIHIEYFDENFNFCSEKFSGLAARIILHEFDHIEGILFVDRLSFLKKRLLKRKLTDISKGKIQVDYEMKFPLKKIKTNVDSI
ncbi:MAG: peptide deformylase [Bacteroidota bacterium]